MRRDTSSSHREPLPTALQVRVKALAPTFYVEGQQAVAGEVYTVPCDIAQGLAHIGKARLLQWTE
jgi:hypothetical protein